MKKSKRILLYLSIGFGGLFILAYAELYNLLIIFISLAITIGYLSEKRDKEKS